MTMGLNQHYWLYTRTDTIPPNSARGVCSGALTSRKINFFTFPSRCSPWVNPQGIYVLCVPLLPLSALIPTIGIYPSMRPIIEKIVSSNRTHVSRGFSIPRCRLWIGKIIVVPVRVGRTGSRRMSEMKMLATVGRLPKGLHPNTENSSWLTEHGMFE